MQDPDPSHVGRNIVTLDKDSKDKLGITSGDYVEIEGVKKTAAIVWPARPEDEGQQLIRMDNFLRHNAGINLGEKVRVRRAIVNDAKKVVLAPTQEVRIIASGYDRILKRNFIGRPLVRGDSVWISVFGSGFVYTVEDTNPRGIVKVTDFTQFVLKEQPVKQKPEVSRIAYEDIGGLGDQVQKVRDMIELPMRHPELFRRLGIQPPKGVLLFGPPGTGKTLLAKAVANETNAHFIPVAAPSIMCVGGETRILVVGGEARIFPNPAGEKTAETLFEEGLKTGKIVNDGLSKIVELSEPVNVFSVNPDLKIVKGRITHVTKLRSKTLCVKTSLGEEILVSPNHPFGVLVDSKALVWKKAGELKKGDSVAVVKVSPGSPFESSRIGLCTITAIEPEGEKELFDFTVEPFNNFLAGHSLLVLHNSKFVGEAEERIRQVFKEAEDNAPSIIFFDEIDAVAPKRDEVIGEVERRVVAQLLASMDGMEARGNVIVIAATNRINSIDEALRRPGRFDREIEFPVPDKAGRKQVLQIHTRGMPLNPSFELDAVRSYFQANKEVSSSRKEELLKALDDILQKDPPKNSHDTKEEWRKKQFLALLNSKESEQLSQALYDRFMDYFASITHGFVGADLAALVKESAMKALRRYLPQINLEEETIPPEVLEQLEVNKTDFLEGLKDVQPSALREVTIEVPNVKWSDVGALEEVKKELRQAIEWPLKHPEAFKKMGIRPPKGVLLFGPPGTGKTMLAKAVATESEANFISIKGPELVSMWVGESLPFDEELLVFDGKKIFREQIGKIVEEKKDVQVVAFDNDGKAFFAKITDFISHPLTGKMFELTTRTGRKIRVTDKHSLFSLVENEIEPVTVNQLAEGKSVIAVPARLPNISFESSVLDLADLFSEKQQQYFIQSPQTVQWIKSIGYPLVSKLLNKKTKFLYDIADKNLPVSLQDFLLLSQAAHQNPLLDQAFISRKGARHALPALLPLTEAFFELLGLWVAEGEFNNEMLRFTIFDSELQERFLKGLSSMGLVASARNGSWVVNSTTLHDVFVGLGLESGAFRKKVPSLLFTAKPVQANAFLRGYFSGDGTIRKNGHSVMVEATTVSKTLANDLLYLLLKQGIVAFCKNKKEWNGNNSFRVQLFGIENLQKFRLAGFIDSGRNGLLNQYLVEVQWKRSNVIPVNEKIQNLLSEAFVYYPNNKAVGLHKVREALVTVDMEKQRFADLWKLCESDIYWDKVESIRKIDYTGNVFDVSVEPCQNFVAGFGGIFAHNSERGVRNIFKKARQVAPVIVFFDEIDAVASRRGSMGDSGTGDRMVNQLLTELDGVESLKDVVFIAATNRPDLIDPALLRPGRLDKVIHVPSPDEEARLAILKVHSRGVPLSKDISLEELAKKTKGFSGADLEGLIREAALFSLEESKLKGTTVQKKHLEAVLSRIKPSISQETEEAYEEFKAHKADFKPSYIE